MIKTIIFDFGNVIGFFDPRRVSERLAAHAEMVVHELHSYLYGGPLEEAYELGRLTTEEFLHQLRTTCGLRCSQEVLLQIYPDMFWPNQDVCEFVPRLKPRYRLLLLSNTNDLHARHFQQQFADTFQHFDALVFSHEVGVRKPQRGIFEHCLRLAACAPEECLFIDDLPANVAGAQALGWHGIVYRDFADFQRQMESLGIVY